MSIYQFKAHFQAILRPLTFRLYDRGVTANQVTVFACALSVLLGLGLYSLGRPSTWFILIPIWMFLRMALNAIDGMLAREFGQKSDLGAYLNEITDVVSDAALYLPFVWVAPISALQIGLIIWLSALSELSGILGHAMNHTRHYDGPMGKSDRAFVFGALGLWVACVGDLPNWGYWLMWALVFLVIFTIVRRVRSGLKKAP